MRPGLATVVIVTSRLPGRFIFDFMLLEGLVVIGLMVVEPSDLGAADPLMMGVTEIPALAMLEPMDLGVTEIPGFNVVEPLTLGVTVTPGLEPVIMVDPPGFEPVIMVVPPVFEIVLAAATPVFTFCRAGPVFVTTLVMHISSPSPERTARSRSITSGGLDNAFVFSPVF